jgi:hypothetical protein
MTQRAVLELQVLEFLVQGLVFAHLAHVVFLHYDAHATGNTWREMGATLLAVDITKQMRMK